MKDTSLVTRAKLFLRQLRRKIPRWVVLVIDLNITLLSYFICKLSLYAYLKVSVQFQLTEVLALLLCYGLGFSVMKVHRRVVRYISLQDLMQVLFASIIGLILLIISNSLLITPSSTIRPYFILLHFGVNTLFLIILRILYKEFYDRYVMLGKFKKRVLIFGAGQLGLQALSGIQGFANAPFSVYGFIDDNKKIKGTKISGIRVFHTDQIDTAFISRYHISEIIFAVELISADRVKSLIEKFEHLPVKLKRTPPFREWLNSDFKPQLIKDIAIEDLLEREPIELAKDSIKNQVKDKVILVTGAAGSIGSEIARQLFYYPVSRLILIDNGESSIYELQQEFKAYGKDLSHVKFIVGDIRDYPRLDALFAKFQPHLIYHAAAYKHVPLMEEGPYEAVSVNIRGTKNLVDLADIYGVEKFIMVSTDKAVNPTNVMGATKRIAELYVAYKQSMSLVKFVTTRFGNVLGSNGSVVPLFKKQIQQGGPVLVTHPEITRFFMTIPEACQLVLEAGSMGNGGEIYVFDMGESVKIMDLAKRMIRLSGLKYPEDIDIKIVGLRPGEKIYEELLADGEVTVPTHHNKIMISRVRNNWQEDFKTKIDELIDINHSKDTAMELVKRMKHLVPEYKSQNSVFESLDQSSGADNA